MFGVRSRGSRRGAWRRHARGFLKKGIPGLLLCPAIAFTVTGCSPREDQPLPAVTLAEAQEAFHATSAFLSAAWNDTTIRLDNGASSDYQKWQNPAGTLTWEATRTNGAYPYTYTCTGYSHVGQQSGYTFSGSIREVWTSSVAGTWSHDLDLDHDSKPVKQVTGTLTDSDGTISGSLQFNNDAYSLEELVVIP